MSQAVTKVALSTDDTNKWSTLLEKRHRTLKLESTSIDYERTGPILQRQRRLTKVQVIEMAARYEEGATVYELAADFGCNRATVAAQLKKAGIVMRLQPSPKEVVHEMVHLYQSGLSLADVGLQVGTSAGTVLRYISDQGVKTRDTHRRTTNKLLGRRRTFEELTLSSANDSATP